MQVAQQDGQCFYTIYSSLLRSVNQALEIVDPVSTNDAFLELPPQVRLPVRNALYEHIELFDAYLERGDPTVPPGAPEVVRAWRDHHVRGRFYVLKHLKRHTIFLSGDRPTRAYGVLGLADPLSAMLPDPPYLVDAVLLPFKGAIIYDGLLTGPGVGLRFGAGARVSINDSYRAAKAAHGVITTLPHEPEPSGESSDVQSLKRYLSSQRNREVHEDQILALRRKSPELERLYCQERGKAHARTYGQRLRQAGIEEGWFAIYDGLVVASATSQAALQERVREIMPRGRHTHPYLFQLKRR